MEALEKALAREARKLSESILDPVVVHNMDDIKRVVSKFDPNKNQEHQEIEISTNIEFEGDTYQIKANTKSRSHRDMIMEGLSMIKNRIENIEEHEEEEEYPEINGVTMKPNKISSGSAGKTWVDPLIEQWTGGHREHLLICWDIDDYKYKYDIFNHKLTRVKHGNEPPASGTV